MIFRPCIDLHDGRVKQIVGSSISDEKTDRVITNFCSDKSPAYFARLYKDSNLKGGHVIMLGPGNEKAALEAIQAYPYGLQIGGGINSDNAGYWLRNGAAKVIVTSYIFPDGKLSMKRLHELSEITGREKLVIDLSCKRKNNQYVVVLNRWQTFSDVIISKNSLKSFAEYCSEFLIHAVDKEGKMQGVDKQLIKMLANINRIPITYAGGVKSWEDIEIIESVGAGKIDFTVGSALDIFGGHIKYTELVARYGKSTH